ncbi:MAG: hypothetical protein R3B48_03050 [Kofleriaceae bacterium]
MRRLFWGRWTSAAPLCVGVTLAVASCGRLGFDGVGPEGETEPGGTQVVVNAPVSSFSTSSRTFVDVPSGALTISPAAGETWLVLLSARLGSTSLGQESVEARFLVDGVEQGLSGVGNEAVNAGGAWMHFTALRGAGAPVTIQVQLRDVDGAATIDSLRMLAARLPRDADPYLASVDVAVATAASWTGLARINLQPATPGDYLVLAEATGRESPCTTGGVGVRVQTDRGELWPALTTAFPNRVTSYQGVSRTTRVGFSLARRVSLSGPASFELQARSGDAVGCDVTNVRMIAFRTDGFADVASTEELAEVSVADADGAVISSLTVPGGSDARYLVVQSFTMSSAAPGLGERRATFRANGAEVAAYTHAMDNENYRAPYGVFYLLEAPAATVLESTCASGTPGVTVMAKESVIHALRL